MNRLPFLRTLVILNGAVPLFMLAWDAWQGQLGANSVNNALHITGILSLVFLFLSLMMTPLRWMTGWAGWIAFRRSLGLYGFFYAVLHLAIYIGFDRALSLSSTLREIWMRRFLQVGALSILLMAPLAITSTSGMIQKLGPKRWKLLHRLAYPVAILGVLHYYMLVKSDVRQPLAFAGVLACLLLGRFGRHYYELLNASKTGVPRAATPQLTAPTTTVERVPESLTPAPAKARQQWKGELRIGAIFQETHDVKTFRLIALDGGPLPFEYQPGQFLTVHLSIGDKRVNRSYTLASSPSRGLSCELTIKREPLGLASCHMHDHQKVGDTLKVSGPAGKFVFTGSEESAVLLIAGGVGITPVMSILRYLTDSAWSGDIYFLIVAKTDQDLIFREEILALEQRVPHLHVCVTLTRSEESRTWTGERGRATANLLQRFVPDLVHVPVYLCGPNEMMDATRALLREVGVPDSLVHTEAFSSKKSASETANEASQPIHVHVARPAILETQVKASSAASIRFTRSQIETEISSDTTILESAEAMGVQLTYECRSGICGQCKMSLTEGRVQMDCEDALSASEKAAGFVLACQARPLSNLVVDA
jgi:ferredoxin-NADP reductase/DMSO/TMAO reductase YedYZ heme-binding membrane subunit